MSRSGIITLTTDFGLRDPYVAAMKGVILSIFPRASLVDVTHGIEPGDLREAADTLVRIVPLFPPGTVHVAVVDPGVGGERRPMAARAGGHLLVGPDNGILWPLLRQDSKRRAVHLQDERFFRTPVSRTFHGRDVFAPVAAHLASGTNLDALGEAVSDPVRLEIRGPVRRTDGLDGEITRVDRFGNLITNIRRADLEGTLGGRTPVIEADGLRVTGIQDCYEDAAEGEALAIMGSDGFLELSVNRGRALDRLVPEKENPVGTAVRVRTDG